MTLRQLRITHSDLFHPNQDWFEGETFMDRRLDAEPLWLTPPRAIGVGKIPPLGEAPVCIAGRCLPFAITLASGFVKKPDAIIWQQHWFWCADTDRHGQRVYVGVTERGFEIHRHLHITKRWAVPAWG
jgi:hypothetical protein